MTPDEKFARRAGSMVGRLVVLAFAGSVYIVALGLIGAGFAEKDATPLVNIALGFILLDRVPSIFNRLGGES